MAKKTTEEVIDLCRGEDGVKIRLPLIPGQKQEALYVSVNNMEIVVPRGKVCLVPAWAAEVIDHMETEIIAAEEYRNSIGMK